MANDPPYGGRIEVQQGGFVVWQASPRLFKGNKDLNGTLKYTIRFVDSERYSVESHDHKCQVFIKDSSWASNDEAFFLIVSGYATPPSTSGPNEEETAGKVVGQEYYVTADRLKNSDTSMPLFDLTLHYDDYDLEEADLPESLKPEALTLCYQHWSLIPLPTKFGHPIFDPKASLENLQAAYLIVKLEDEMYEVASKREYEIAAQLRNQIAELRKNAGTSYSLIWVSGWKRVQDRQSTVIAGTSDLHAITAEKIIKRPGSRAITAVGLNKRGTFALMYHPKSQEHLDEEHSSNH